MASIAIRAARSTRLSAMARGSSSSMAVPLPGVKAISSESASETV